MSKLSKQDKIDFLVNKGYSRPYLEYVAEDWRINQLFNAEDAG